MSTAPSLEPDCARCAALCCMALAFDRSEMFGFDKPAGVGCRNLTRDRLCRIHGSLDDQGFGGCVAFSCNGAGQRVTQDLFDGATWQTKPQLIGPMISAFRVMRALHDILVLLNDAMALPIPEPAKRQIQSQIDVLTPPQGWSLDDLDHVETLLEAARVSLGELRTYVAPSQIAQTMKMPAPSGETPG